MCGICGVFGSRRDPDVRDWYIRVMTGKLAHRGPDGEGFIGGEDYSMGHRRLAVIDIEGGSQPMVSPDGRYIIVLNGEIYNYRELRNDLESVGERFHTKSDTEVLLRLLMREGRDALPRLNGMFAFAFLDRATGNWLLARDALGIKPLYYFHTGEEFYFASEIKAILAHPEVPRELYWPTFEQYLTFQFSLGKETFFRGIDRLEPGHYLEGNGHNFDRPAIYWAPDYNVDWDHTEEYFRDRLRFLLEDSVRLQMRSDVPLGAHLSGGLDSSLVASIAARLNDSPMRLFHGRFAEGVLYDESRFARTVAREVGGSVEICQPSEEEFVSELPRLIYAMDEPAAGPGLFPQAIVNRLARKTVKVVLGGQGGDEIFGGYARSLIGYLEQSLKGAIFETQEEGRHIVTLASIIPNLPLLREYHPLMQEFWKEGLFQDMSARYYRLLDRSPESRSLLHRQISEEFDDATVYERFRHVFDHPQTDSYINRMTHFDLKTLLPALLQVEDRVSMAVGLESRVPLLDTRIVELVNSIPPNLKFKGGCTKYIFRKTVAPMLPKAVLERKDKMGFPVPLHKWLRRGPVRDFVHDILLSARSYSRGLFDQSALRKALEGEKPYGRQIWGALCIELWHRAFIDSKFEICRNAGKTIGLSTPSRDTGVRLLNG